MDHCGHCCEHLLQSMENVIFHRHPALEPLKSQGPLHLRYAGVIWFLSQSDPYIWSVCGLMKIKEQMNKKDTCSKKIGLRL